MQLVEGGPDIPYEVLTAQEEGRLILFCGAGVSMKAGLPDFKGLIKGIYSELRVEPNGRESRAIEKKDYGLVIDLLEERFGFQKFRESVRKIILKVPATLSVHSSILQLSANRKGQQKRVVTTNFDLLFEKADNNLISYSAPALPVPKLDRWSGIVHLHGRINSDHQERDLVLTSSDFGTAYMSEGWASRFVIELFRNYTVLFIGYGIKDPVVRYLLDALEADRRQRGENQKAYALISRDEKDDWTSKSVTLIDYNPSRGHRVLHETLALWSNLWSGGPLSKISTMRQLAIGDPQAMQSHERNNLIELLQDPKVTNQFAKMGKQIDFSWCEELGKAGLLNTPDKIENALVRKAYSPDLDTKLDPIRFYLAAWISEHIADPISLHWVMSKGIILHERFKEHIRFQLKNCDMHPKLRMAWGVLSGTIPLSGDRGSQRDEYGLLNRINREDWNPKMRIEILDALSPCLEFSPWKGPYNQLLELTRSQEELIDFIFHPECVLRCRNIALEIYQKFMRQEYGSAIAMDYAFGFTGLLKRAMDMQAIIGDASETRDLSSMKIARITGHPRDIELNSNSWVILVALLWRAYDCVRKESLETASTLVDTWRTHRYPVFRRLILAAVSQGAEEDADR